VWYHQKTGSGRPLVLLHGIGMSHAVWNPVVPFLCSTRHVIAFDTAGFGVTPPLPAGTPPTVSNLVEALEQSIRQIGIELPVDIAGNSLGGCMALEAAKRGMARSVVAISPSCLWKEHPPHHVKYVFWALRHMTTRFPNFLKATMQIPMLRELGLAVPLSVGSGRMPVIAAQRVIDDLRASTAFEATFENTGAAFFGDGISTPVTVAFGNRDWILTKSARQQNGLPTHTKWVEKRGWGHVRMWVDPAGVAQLILEGTG